MGCKGVIEDRDGSHYEANIERRARSTPSGLHSRITYGILSGMETNTESEKVRENRLRRMAQRQGLTLTKSRRRDPRAVDFGRYWLSDPYASNVIVLGGEWGTTLDDVEDTLLGRDPAR